MNELREFKHSDIAEIKDNIVENRESALVAGLLEKVNTTQPSVQRAFTFLKAGKIVACCGAFKINNVWNIWAIYSSLFDKLSFARIDAALAFRDKFFDLWSQVKGETGIKAQFNIPSDLHNGDKYAKLFSGKFIRKEPSKVFPGINNFVYEVA